LKGADDSQSTVLGCGRDTAEESGDDLSSMAPRLDLLFRDLRMDVGGGEGLLVLSDRLADVGTDRLSGCSNGTGSSDRCVWKYDCALQARSKRD
jgi:hypothetical protein